MYALVYGSCMCTQQECTYKQETERTPPHVNTKARHVNGQVKIKITEVSLAIRGQATKQLVMELVMVMELVCFGNGAGVQGVFFFF